MNAFLIIWCFGFIMSLWYAINVAKRLYKDNTINNYKNLIWLIPLLMISWPIMAMSEIISYLECPEDYINNSENNI